MRFYGASDIVALPKLSTVAAVTLGQELITAGNAQASLPDTIAIRFSSMHAAYDVLHQAFSEQQQAEADPKRAQSADSAEDQAWSAFHDWLFGWSKVNKPDAEPARTMYQVLFPTRLKFTQLAYKLEWAEADARLARIDKAGFAAEIAQLGVGLVLEHLRDTHRAYGEALGITAPGQDTTPSGLREPLNQFLKCLRSYILVVAAHADEANPESVSLTDSLLSPLQRWQSRAPAAATPPVEPPSPPAT